MIALYRHAQSSLSLLLKLQWGRGTVIIDKTDLFWEKMSIGKQTNKLTKYLNKEKNTLGFKFPVGTDSYFCWYNISQN